MNIQEQFNAFIDTPGLFTDDKITSYSAFLTPGKVTIDEETKITNIVFGKRMEEFLQLYFEQSDNYKILAKGLQINKEKITIGELDFIVKENNSVIHLELVTKFYVYNPEEPIEINRWIGPNKKDSLVQKLHKLQSKQFPLLHKEPTKEALTSLQLNNTEIEQQLCFKAQLFIPYGFDTKKIEPTVNLNCIVGYWLRINQVNTPDFENATYFIPEKSDWYCLPRSEVEWESFSTLLPRIVALHKSQKSPLVWINKRGSIFEKCFIIWW